MNSPSSILTIIIICLGMGLKFARLNRAVNGQPSSSYDVGYEMGASMSGGNARKSTGGYSSGVQGNPFAE